MWCSTSSTEHGDVVACGSDRISSRSAVDVLGAQPAGRLVEQQQPRPADQRPGQRDLLLHRVRQRGRQPVCGVRDTEPVQPAQRVRAQPPLVAVAARQREQRAREAGPAGARGPDHDVLQRGQAREQPDRLQRAGDADLDQPLGRGRSGASSQVSRARGRADEAA